MSGDRKQKRNGISLNRIVQKLDGAEGCYSEKAKIENLTRVEVFIQRLRTNECKT